MIKIKLFCVCSVSQEILISPGQSKKKQQHGHTLSTAATRYLLHCLFITAGKTYHWNIGTVILD